VLRSRSDPPEFGNGVKLSEDGWKINGCPETGARFAQTPDGTLWAAWFTAGGVPGVYLTSSRDGGASFARRTLMSTPGRLARPPEIGALPDGRIVLLYESIEEGGARPLVARVRAAAGEWGPPRSVASEGGLSSSLGERRAGSGRWWPSPGVPGRSRAWWWRSGLFLRRGN